MDQFKGMEPDLIKKMHQTYTNNLPSPGREFMPRSIESHDGNGVHITNSLKNNKKTRVTFRNADGAAPPCTPQPKRKPLPTTFPLTQTIMVTPPALVLEDFATCIHFLMSEFIFIKDNGLGSGAWAKQHCLLTSHGGLSCCAKKSQFGTNDEVRVFDRNVKVLSITANVKEHIDLAGGAATKGKAKAKRNRKPKRR